MAMCGEPERRTKIDGTTMWYVSFYTAWTPPEAWTDKLASRFPKLAITLATVDEFWLYASWFEWREGKQVTKLMTEDVDSRLSVDIWCEAFNEERREFYRERSGDSRRPPA